MTEQVLTGDEIQHSFGDLDVLTDVSVSVEPGTVTALIGPNGSGKTTLLRILAGVLSPSAGAVDYRGPDSARQIGYMPQQPSFRAGFTARETLEFYTALADGDPQELLDRVGLGAVGDRRVESLSGGMRRLLGIAQATVGSPPVIIVDEPGSGLDPGMRRRTYETISDIADDGTAVLFSSHDMAFTEQFADRVLALDEGTVAASGPPAALCQEFETDTLQAAFEAIATRQSSVIGSRGDAE
jgi:ABC-type multidrug transport system ATPase subunit